ncbi:MAG: hypothetical protein JXC36_04750, partial [Candidatus Atribacteria bacterium]|nr:hypothetical protein [Candidatus Atribacteria bacterium]
MRTNTSFIHPNQPDKRSKGSLIDYSNSDYKNDQINKMKIKESVIIVKRNGIFHLLDNDKKIKRFKPWLGDIFSFL